MTLYAVNILWSVSTLSGLFLAAYLAREGYLDLKALQALGANGDKSILAKATVASGAVGALGQLCMFVPAVPSFFAPTPADPFSWAVALLIMGSWCLTAKTAITVWANRKVQGDISMSRSQVDRFTDAVEQLHDDNIAAAKILDKKDNLTASVLKSENKKTAAILQEADKTIVRRVKSEEDE